MQDVAAAARDGVAALEPSDADGDLARLVDRVRSAGLVIDADLDDATLLDPEVRFLVHRVLQEALTNVLRHAPGSRASLTLVVGDQTVELSVTNTPGARPGGPPGSGRGLAGIRERVADWHGAVSCGPLTDGGFQVHAVLPLARVVETVVP
jgi:signal transduction histidine kinase